MYRPPPDYFRDRWCCFLVAYRRSESHHHGEEVEMVQESERNMAQANVRVRSADRNLTVLVDLVLGLGKFHDDYYVDDDGHSVTCVS